MKGKKLISIALSSLLLTSGVCALAACGDEPTPSGGDDLSSKDLPATTSVISLADYTSKVKAGIAGSMAGVAYGYKDFVHGKKWEFASKNWIAASILPKWSDVWVPNGYDQDDIYLAISAIEALHNLGLDATSKELGIYMYNKNFEFWDGSNSDVLDRGYAPPYSGYPTDKTPDFTNAYSDGNSYQCGAEFGGYLGLNMTGAANELVHRVAEICTYGDGIYATQFISAMYGEAFFTNDISQVIDAGLAAIPEDSWSAEVIKDVLKNKEDGKSAEENYESIMKKYCDWNGSSYTSPYQWINWPSGNILLDAKMCSAFTVIGLLYGEGDLEKSVKYTVQCANDCDSTAAATAGILSVMKGWENLDSLIKDQIIENQYFKYTQLTVNSAAEACTEMVQEIVKAQGGQVAKVDGVLSLVIPEAAKGATIEKYTNGKTVTSAELGSAIRYTDEEMARLRYFKDPGFERCQNDGTAQSTVNSGLGWETSLPANVKIECLKQTSHSGLANAIITAKNGTTISLSNTTSRALQKNTNYEFSTMIQVSSGFASEIKLAVWNNAGTRLRAGNAVEVKDGWYKVTFSFNSGENTVLKWGLQLAGKNDTDTVRVDDFELRVK